MILVHEKDKLLPRVRFIHDCSGIWLADLPPKWPNHFSISRTIFRTKFYALRFNDARYEGIYRYGVDYEWLGVKISIGRK